MDREGFRNRLKQYKQAREENPGLKYWEWKNLPKYDEGGEVVDPIEQMQKRRNVAINMQGKPNQFLDEWNTARLATGRFDAQLGNGNLEQQKANRDSAPIFSTPNAFASRAALRGVVPIRLSSDTDQMVIDRYNSDLRVQANKLFKTVTSAEEGKERKGTYDRDSHTIYVKPDSPETLIHEQSHASKARPQEAKIAEILKNNDETKSLYYDDPTGREPYGRLMQVREANQIDPNKVWDKESYKEFKKNAIDFNFLNRYSDDTVIDIFNNVADAGDIRNEENKIFVAAEGGIVPKYDDGTDGVTGPPTYEQWNADMNQYNPTILDNASMYWSIEAAKKALHKEAMKLPGYAERWTEYYRSLPKNDPDINEFVDELWANENPNNAGLKNGKYYPHKSPEGGKPTIGPGFKIGSGSHRITKKQAERGMTKARLNQEARYIGKQHLNAVDQFINYGQTTNPADTVSPQIKMGLMDLRHQVGPLNEWGNLRQAVLNGDLEGIRKESTVTWKDNGKTKVDKRRKKIRDEKYFYYE